MASRLADSKALATRCKKAGWDVVETGDGWKVDTGSQPFVIHRTYSDVRSLTNATATLERLGLLDAEATTKLSLNERRRQAARKAKEDEAKALENAQALAERNADLVNRASGPYMTETEDVPYEWFATPHPAPWVRRVWMTPTLAKKILDNHNLDNRPKGDEHSEHLRNVVLSDQWKLTHQGAAMDTRGYLQDAQHRLEACVLAGEVAPDTRIPMFFWVGMPVENFKAIDENRVRTAAQLFGKAKEKNGSVLQPAMRLVIAYRAADGNVRRAYRMRYTNAQILEAFENDAELMRDCAALAKKRHRKLHCSPSVLAAALFLIRKANRPDNLYVDRFFEGLFDGRKVGTRLALDDADPRQVLKEELMRIASSPKNRRPPLDMLALFILSWNNVVLERFPGTLKFGDDQQPPQVLICDDTNSAVPRTLDGEFEQEHAVAAA